MGTIKTYILHGWTYSPVNGNPLEKWNDFINLMSIYKLNPILLQIPGITKNIDEVWNLDKYVDWLKKIVWKDDKIILIGHSNGGRIAAAFTAQYPEKVNKLILIDSAGIYHNELPHRLKKFVFKNLAKLGKKVTSSQSLRIFLYKLAREGDYKNAAPSQRQTMINLINLDLSKTFSKIKTPTLIIWGEDDKVTPLSDAKLIHKLIVISQVEIIKEAKHSPQFTNTKEVIERINKFL